MNLKEELLSVHEPEWFMDFAGTAGLKDANTPEETAEAVSETLLDPQIMMDRMLVLHDEDIDFIHFCLKQDHPFLPSRGYYDSADELRDLQYGFVVIRK